PQFPYSRARAAHDIVSGWDGVRPVNVIEIGAGSGALAVELFLALKHQGKDMARVTYRGPEPSEAMRAGHPQNSLHPPGGVPRAGGARPRSPVGGTASPRPMVMGRTRRRTCSCSAARPLAAPGRHCNG